MLIGGRVHSPAAVYAVIAGAAVENIVARAAKERVVPGAAPDLINVGQCVRAAKTVRDDARHEVDVNRLATGVIGIIDAVGAGVVAVGGGVVAVKSVVAPIAAVPFKENASRAARLAAAQERVIPSAAVNPGHKLQCIGSAEPVAHSSRLQIDQYIL